MMSAHDVVAEYRAAAAARDWEHADGTQAGPCFFDLTGDGKIAEITDFWPEPAELPESRARLVERY